MHNSDSPHATDSHDTNRHVTDTNIKLCHRECRNEWNPSVIRTSQLHAADALFKRHWRYYSACPWTSTQSQQKPVCRWYQHENKSLESQQELNTCTHWRARACRRRRFSHQWHRCSKCIRHWSDRNTKLNDTDITTKGSRTPQTVPWGSG